MVLTAIVVLLYSYVPVVMECLVALLCMGGIYELYSATGFIKNRVLSAILILVLTLTAFFDIPLYPYILGVVFLVMVSICIYLMKGVKRITCISPVLTVSISIMMALMYKSISEIRLSERGLILLIFAALIGVLTDTGAYFVGKTMGKHKLAPVLSPKKTVEGAIGGTLLALIVVLLCSLCVNRIGFMHVNVFNVCIFTVIGSVVGQFGDLAMSSIKRIAGIKDYGKIFPGHGGVLDRFDSLMFVLPLTYLASQYIIPFF